jgi:hypothetical protein
MISLAWLFTWEAFFLFAMICSLLIFLKISYSIVPGFFLCQYDFKKSMEVMLNFAEKSLFESESVKIEYWMFSYNMIK